MRPSGKFVPFAEMAKKWGYPEDELIQLAIQKEFNLYCFKPIPSADRPLRIPFYIGNELSDFLPGNTSISCSQFFFKTSDYEEGTFISICPEDRKFAEMYCVGRPELNLPSVTIERSDLFLHHEEIADMESRYPSLAGEKTEHLTEERNSNNDNVLTPEEMALIKTVFAMAVDYLTYDPKQNKSSVPRKVAEVVSEFYEEGITDDTVRFWLQVGAGKRKCINFNIASKKSLLKMFYSMAANHFQDISNNNIPDAILEEIVETAASVDIKITSDTVNEWLKEGVKLKNTL